MTTTKTEALTHLARCIAGEIRRSGSNPADATEMDVMELFNEERLDAEPGSHGAEWVEVFEAWIEESILRKVSPITRLVNAVRKGI